MKLDAYLERIGFNRFEFGAPLRADLPTLQALHRAHQFAVPFENLDVQLRRPLGLDIEAAYDKIVRRRRGGWCYELNGLMGWMLEHLGFSVTRMSAGVMRERVGDAQLGNHLCLLVRIDRQPYLVDVGFGGSLTGPMPLTLCTREDSPYQLALGHSMDGYWRFAETAPGDAPFTFDFHAEPADESELAAKCRSLQSDPLSPFVQNLVVQRRSADTHLSLRGRVLSTLRATGIEKRLLEAPEEFVSVLRSHFDLDLPEAASLWPAICARHDALFRK